MRQYTEKSRRWVVLFEPSTVSTVFYVWSDSMKSLAAYQRTSRISMLCAVHNLTIGEPTHARESQHNIHLMLSKWLLYCSRCIGICKRKRLYVVVSVV